MRLPRRHTGRHVGPRARRPVGTTSSLATRLHGQRPRRSMRGHLGRAGVRTLARALVATVVLVGLANLAPSADLPTAPFAVQSPSPAQRELMERFDCSTDGFGDGSEPRSAIIREDGDLRVVSFDRGWQVYTGDRPHALVAICHAPPR
jgi:hypothetical protein